MITASDIIHLPYTSDLSDGGIEYAVRSLPHTYDRMGGSQHDRLRRIAAGVAVELAFRRFLTEQGVRFDVKGATPFTDPDRYDVALGGRRCDIKSFIILNPERIKEMRADPGVLLDAPALVPSDQHAGPGHSEHDLYLFAFLEAVLATTPENVKLASQSGQKPYLLYSLAEEWARPQVWRPIGPLALKSEAEETVTVELAGQNGVRDFVTRTVKLEPRTRVEIDDPFFSLCAVHAESLPGARVGIHSPVLKAMALIPPGQWGDIRVYGREVLLAGYITHREFGAKAERVPAGTRVFQYDQTRAKNLAVPVRELHALGDLVERAKGWQSEE